MLSSISFQFGQVLTDHHLKLANSNKGRFLIERKREESIVRRNALPRILIISSNWLPTITKYNERFDEAFGRWNRTSNLGPITILAEKFDREIIEWTKFVERNWPSDDHSLDLFFDLFLELSLVTDNFVLNSFAEARISACLIRGPNRRNM